MTRYMRGLPAQEQSAPSADVVFGKVAIPTRGGRLALPDNGVLEIGQIKLTATGLELGAVSADDWEKLGYLLAQWDNGIQWMIADWINFGERTWKVTYDSMSALTGYAAETLYDLAAVGRAFEFPSRDGKVAFSCYRHASWIQDAEYRHALLAYVSAARLTVAKMQAARKLLDERVPGQQAEYLRYAIENNIRLEEIEGLQATLPARTAISDRQTDKARRAVEGLSNTLSRYRLDELDERVRNSLRAQCQLILDLLNGR